MGIKRGTANDLTRQVLDYLKLHHFFAWRQNSVGVWDAARKVYRKPRNALRGVSDVLAVFPPDGPCAGRLLAVEIKCGKDRLSPEQAAFLDAINRQGGLALVVHDLRDLIAALAALEEDA